jgi:hypothetical protein
MVRFEDLQDLWQHQQPPAGRTDTASLTRALSRYGRRQTWIFLAKLAAVVAVIGWQIAQSRGSFWALCGVALTAALAMVLLAVDWRNQRAISQLNFAEPSVEFVRNAMERLMEQREPFRKYYWPLMFFVVGAINLILGDLPDSITPLRRLAWHVICSALPFAGYEVGRRVRIRRFEAECRPLVDRLTALEHALEERSE